MNVLPVTRVKAVLIAITVKVNMSRPETGLPHTRRNAAAPTIHAKTTITAAATLNSTNVAHNSTVGTNTAVARLAATRTAISRGLAGAVGTVGTVPRSGAPGPGSGMDLGPLSRSARWARCHPSPAGVVMPSTHSHACGLRPS